MPRDMLCNDTLPIKLEEVNTLHELLALAIEDFEAIRKNLNYKINMAFWHYRSDNCCYVCMAGSVMANKFNVHTTQNMGPSDFSGEIGNRLHAINFLRMGDVFTAAVTLGSRSKLTHLKSLTNKWQPILQPWSFGRFKDWDQFTKHMREMQSDLAEAGV